MGPYTRTRAIIHRARHTTTHLILPDWQHGQILCPAPTATIGDLLDGLPLADWPGIELTVYANLNSWSPAGLAPVGWDLVRPAAADIRKALTPEAGDALSRAWAGSGGTVVPASRWAA
jgi:hypothetical protein